ncbi:hypothetical protein ABPG73_017849 [Tetrahymena malaccensis]
MICNVQCQSNNQYGSQTFSCLATQFSEFSQNQIFGLLDLQHQYSYQFSNGIIPHYQISIKVDILLIRTVDPTDSFQIKVFEQTNELFASGLYTKSNYNDGYQICSNMKDTLILFSDFIKPSYNFNLVFISNLNQNSMDEAFGIKNLYIYLNTCHPSCSTCDGPNSNNCLSCSDNSKYDSSNKICQQCSIGYLYHQGTCVAACPSQFQSDSTNQICIKLNIYCDSYNLSTMNCDSCKSISYKIDGECVKTISSYSPLIPGENSQVLFKSLTLDSFAEITVANYQFQINNFRDEFYDQKRFTKSTVTLCGDYQILGGAYLASTGSSIEKSFSNLQQNKYIRFIKIQNTFFVQIRKPHWKIDISFVAFKIDQWQISNKIYSIQVLIDNQQTNIQEKVLQGLSNICGINSQNDQIVQITGLNLLHNSQSLHIQIQTDLDQNSSIHSFGIREFYVQIHYCPDPNCLACSDINNCTSCKQNTFLYQGACVNGSIGTCVNTCSTNYYGELSTGICTLCNKQCKECSGGSSQCTSQCRNGFYPGLSNNLPNCIACESTYGEGCLLCDQKQCNKCSQTFFTFGIYCVDKCPQNTITSFINMTCSQSCAQPFVVQDNVCQDSCKEGYYASSPQLISNNLITNCEKCDSKCKKCQKSSDDCTLCSDMQSTDCMSEARKTQYIELKICESFGLQKSQIDCQNTVSSSQGKHHVENVVGFISVFFMILLFLSGYKFVGFLSIYYIQVVQMIGNYCLINIDYLYVTKELALKYALTHNYFNLIPTEYIFPKNESMETLFSSQYYPMLIKVQPLMDLLLLNFFYQGLIIVTLYCVDNVFISDVSHGFHDISLDLSSEDEYLLQSFFTQSIIQDTSNWIKQLINYNSVGPQLEYPQQIFTCFTTDYSEFSQNQIYGILDDEHKYTYSFQNGIIPHYQISIKVDILLLRTVDPEDGFQIILSDQNDNQLFASDWYKKIDFRDGYIICSEINDTLIRFSKIINISSNNIKLIFYSKLDQDYFDEGFGIKNLNIYLNTCHPSCLTCDGPYKENCLSCDDSSKYDSQLKICQQCSNGQFYHQGKCISACPDQFQNDQNQVCVKIPNNCINYNPSTMKCDSCKQNPPTYIIDGECVSLISQNYQPLALLDNYSQIIFKSLTLNSFGEINVNNYQFQTNFYDDFVYKKKQTDSTVTLCGNYQILGGAYLASVGASIEKSFNNLKPHWQIDITFVAFKIDQWQTSQKNYSIKIEIDDQKIDFDEQILQQPTQICGLISQNDQIVQINALRQSHSSNSLNIKIYTDLDQDSSVHSFGIREFYVQIHYCADTNCLACQDTNICTSCKEPSVLFQGQCVSQCSNGFYAEKISNSCKPCFYGDTYTNECKKCDPNCKECNGSSINCTQCNTQSFLQKSTGQCLQSCDSKYYGDKSTGICTLCDQSCKDCLGGSSNDCLSCYDGTFLQLPQNQCLNNCQIGYYGDITTKTCLKCNSSCKSCNGGQKNNCTSCQAPLFLQISTGECVDACNNNQYGDALTSICTSCHSSCKSCFGGSISECLSCNSGFFYQQSTKQCLNYCNSNQYKDTINNTCINCHETCLTCFGPNSNQCLSCLSTLLFDKNSNMCKTSCDNGFYQRFSNTKVICQTCESTFGEGCILCDYKSCNKCAQNFFLYQNVCVDKCPQKTITSFINMTCSYNCDPPFVLQDNVCQNTCQDGFYPSNSLLDSKNQIVKCLKCDNKCQKCQNSSDDCTVCSDLQSVECMSNDRQNQYLNLKLCESLGYTDSQTDCQSSVLSSNDKYQIENIISFMSALFMLIAFINEYLLQSFFTQNPIPATDLSQWNKVLINNHNYYEYPSSTFTCAQTAYSEFSQSQIYGIFDLEHEYFYQFSNGIIPHYQISIKADLFLLKTIDTDDYFFVQVYDNFLNQQIQGRYYTKYNNYNDGFNICSSYYYDTMVRFSLKTRSSYNFRLLFYSHLNEPYDNESFGIKNLYIYLNTCHPSCFTCDGPNYNNCLSCYDNKKFNPSSNICELCDNGKLYHQGKCVDSCPGLFLADVTKSICQMGNKYCEVLNSSNMKCESCNPQLSYEIDGECVRLIQNYTKLIPSQFTQVLFKSLTLDNFGEMQVNNYQFQINNFYGDFFYQQYTEYTVTKCGNYQILGGAYLASKGASIKKVFTDLKPHWAIDITFVAFKIDAWQDRKIFLQIDSQQATTSEKILDNSKNICGIISYQDQIVQITALSQLHTSPSLSILIYTDLNQLSNVQSFGIREFYVQIHYCGILNCLSCTSLTDCTSCGNNTFLYLGKCVTQCDDSFYGDTITNQCVPCNKNCKTCYGGTDSNCLSCDDGLFFQQSIHQCLKSCNKDQYGDLNTNTCKPCHQDCKTCYGGQNNNCQSCFEKKFLYQCSDGYYNGLSNDQPVCLTCVSAYSEGCILCDQKSCNKCIYPFFSYEIYCVDVCPQNTIISLINKTCSLKCDQPFVLQDSICQNICKDGYYASSPKLIQNNLISKCELCHSQCKKCQKSADDCTLCSDIQSTDCMTEDRKSQYVKQKLCDSLGYVQSQKDCQDLHSSINNKYIAENVVGFISLIFMAILVLTDLKYAGFLSIYYVQIVQMIGNYCLINIDSLYMTKELALKYTLTHNYFNLIPTQQIFHKDERVKTVFSSQYYPMVVKVQPLMDLLLLNFFYQGLIIIMLYSIYLGFQLFSCKNKMKSFLSNNLIVKIWMICSNMLFVGIFTSKFYLSSNLQFEEIYFFVVILAVYILYIYKSTRLVLNYGMIKEMSQVSKKYLVTGLNKALMQRLMWIFFELRKLIIVCGIVFIQGKESIYLNICLNFVFIIYLIAAWPIKNKWKNFNIIFLELFYTTIVSLLLIANKYNISLALTCLLVVFHLIFVVQAFIYLFKALHVKYSKEKYKTKQRSHKYRIDPIQQMTQEIQLSQQKTLQLLNYQNQNLQKFSRLCTLPQQIKLF